ncbi:MAG TPA: STAS domain-containing protein [Streptosporangiaceae bacterium]|nr:STAS domain-containing protein [Streptosporangiaceae bacterium]
MHVIGGVPVVAAPEEIDMTNAAGLQAALLEASALGNDTFVVDMSGTEFCDSAGVHALVQAHKRFRSEGGEMLLAVSAPAVQRVFAIIGIDHLIPIFPTLEQALAHPPATRSARTSRVLTVLEPNSPS